MVDVFGVDPIAGIVLIKRQHVEDAILVSAVPAVSVLSF